MLTGRKTLLAPIMREHRNKLFQWRNDRRMSHLSAEFRPWTEYAFDQWMEMVARRADMHSFVICELVSRAPIGWCFLSDIQAVHRTARLGIAIGEPDYLYRGFGSDAIIQLLMFGFADLNLQRIWLDVFADNAPAIKAYEKCGFVTEGLMRRHYFVNGIPRDAHVMGCLADRVMGGSAGAGL